MVCYKEVSLKRIVGFVGCYSHDVILMLTGVLRYMGKRVLLRDRNRLHTLSVSVPVPEGVCAAETVLEYDGFFFTEREADPEEAGEYEIELVDFGMEWKQESARCSELVVITDMLLHHIRRLVVTEIPKEKVRFCIVRDAFVSACKGEQEVGLFLQSFPNCVEYFLEPDHRDVKNRYVCETMHEYSASKASPEMQAVIVRMAGFLCPECSEREIRRYIKHQGRRRYR